LLKNPSLYQATTENRPSAKATLVLLHLWHG
jgi:hypothetical protein